MHGDHDYKSTTRDVANLLTQLKKDKVDSVLIDLRNNGGGFLDEAINLTGLFIKKGPVVQQRYANGKVKVESDTADKPVWDGPMGVLINRASASASEIFAAAIQDYGRGLIIGEQSFGKGTVQQIVDLDQAARNDKPKYGELKITIAQFFRVNGGTTQLRGVTPDISLPGSIDADEFGESSFDNALPWTQINPADYTPDPATRLRRCRCLANPPRRRASRTNKDYQIFGRRSGRIEGATQEKPDFAQRSRTPQGARQPRKRASRPAKRLQRTARRRQKRRADKKRACRDDGLQANERNLSVQLAEKKRPRMPRTCCSTKRRTSSATKSTCSKATTNWQRAYYRER